MSELNVGILIDCFRIDLDKAVARAAELGADSFQVYVTRGKLNCRTMTPAHARRFARRYRRAGLTLSATCADFGVNYSDEQNAPRGVSLLKKAIDQAPLLETGIITTHIGSLPPSGASRHEDTMLRNLNAVGAYAGERNVLIAVETGLEDGSRLAALLRRLDTDAVRVNFDPANLVMNGFDHMRCLRDLADFVVHTHAKDAHFNDGERPLGEGDVDFPAYLALLVGELGYAGPVTIERETAENPAHDIAEAVRYLRRLAEHPAPGRVKRAAGGAGGDRGRGAP